ncbi:transketolase C-terminal domain-containing protein [Citricoccus sp.]|uniref:alpha-ketoacid dehydrogenase subunit beta n=1 Tax=Citricoccus sp. TaxID=1978372 RepID=UPI0028BF472C|nr:transketolase C-terminal domain-containing protein [Citricoccus sp.]
MTATTTTENTATAPATTITMTMAGALNAGLRRALEADPRVLLMGEDIGRLGGVFRITEGLQEAFGVNRVIDAPLAESGIVGTGIGLAIRGFRPVLEMQFDAFVFPAYDQIINQVAKLHTRTAGHQVTPLVIRIPYGGGIGSPEHHSESPESVFAHHAGLRILTPSTPQDAYWAIQEAVAVDDPVIFFEPKRRYWMKGEVNTSERDGDPQRAVVRQVGTDVTLVSYGPLVPTAVEAAEAAAEEGVSVELIDLRSLNPIDFDTIEASVRRTGRLVVAHEAPTFLGLGSEIAARLSERVFYHLEAPVIRVGAFHAPYPAAKIEHHYVPDVDRLLEGIDRALAY